MMWFYFEVSRDKSVCLEADSAPDQKRVYIDLMELSPGLYEYPEASPASWTGHVEAKSAKKAKETILAIMGEK